MKEYLDKGKVLLKIEEIRQNIHMVKEVYIDFDRFDEIYFGQGLEEVKGYPIHGVSIEMGHLI